MLPPAAVLTDIEGTTTPISFVHATLFPYARARMAGWCRANPAHPALAGLGPEPAETLLGWMDRDEKIPALKAVQGEIWAQGYRAGALIGQLYPDVPPALRRWAGAGLRLFVFSSGSEAAQRDLFAYSDAGDLSGLFQGFFDTRIGPKRDSDSYGTICRGAGVYPSEMLFLSDVEAELDAAETAGLRTCQLLRPGDGATASARHAKAGDFRELAETFALPKFA